MIDHKDEPIIALTIAGLDPSGGAGIVADIKTFTAFGCFAVAAVTSLTFQNTTGVFGAVHQTAETVRDQILPVVEDLSVAGAKTGMLPTRAIIAEVARLFRETPLPAPVVDPVVRSTSGYDLIDDEALEALKRELLPLARIATPNIPEAERITGLRIKDEEGMRQAARIMREMGARAVLIKGGHLADEALDLLDDGEQVRLYSAPRIQTKATHGTGCTLSAAIAACLAHGLSLHEAVARAKDFVTEAIMKAPPIGRGFHPVNSAHSVRSVLDKTGEA
ncbi:bifunctional hydroxymethylpyrimidine kinase/phosphomethylpyrimidine kinase [Pyrinomonas methylaliphatogenes]|uniref:hydroxymethylpyrimidine kinase n=1 Tax=Pyrinomonas methylaliphatogenes TaxID=454194 RepID=A0A0B6WXS9_9BACT|nr:bifunctional hydroxymethylpyrimidine kinase/phosphomethylpyrimidine kinase [Pyrinomonas methylaliphatogenes]MBX5478137.1 bifunctional hydroxymethylpyrimidine kinase/phosphomethylpyrimidine kinase [Pyrinomonas methylaliphatogenes]CDM64975.1 phosphomethylpyrimidine kinase [Pyrinomonas methylaliphatogenes]